MDKPARAAQYRSYKSLVKQDLAAQEGFLEALKDSRLGMNGTETAAGTRVLLVG